MASNQSESVLQFLRESEEEAKVYHNQSWFKKESFITRELISENRIMIAYDEAQTTNESLEQNETQLSDDECEDFDKVEMSQFQLPKRLQPSLKKQQKVEESLSNQASLLADCTNLQQLPDMVPSQCSEPAKTQTQFKIIS